MTATRSAPAPSPVEGPAPSPVEGSATADHRDSSRVRRVEELLAVDNEGLPGIDRNHCRTGRLHYLDCRHADDRDVEAHVLFRLRDFHDARAGPGDLTAAANHGVGAL